MEYIIELFFDLKKVKNITLTKEFLCDLALEYNCSMQYFIHEIDGHSRIIDTNTCIYYINFSEENFDNLINLIKLIKTNTFEIIENVFIDCIYEDGEASNIIYASPNYFRLLNTKYQEKIKIVKQFNEKNNYHKQIMKALNYKNK